jgi:hypothetical protein
MGPRQSSPILAATSDMTPSLGAVTPVLRRISSLSVVISRSSVLVLVSNSAGDSILLLRLLSAEARLHDSRVRYFGLNFLHAGTGSKDLVLHRLALKRSLDFGLLADRLRKLHQHWNACFRVSFWT